MFNLSDDVARPDRRMLSKPATYEVRFSPHSDSWGFHRRNIDGLRRRSKLLWVVITPSPSSSESI